MKKLIKILAATQWSWSSTTNNLYLPLWWLTTMIPTLSNPKLMILSMFLYDFGFFIFCQNNKKNKIFNFYKNNNFSNREIKTVYMLSHLACLGATGLFGSALLLLGGSLDAKTWISFLLFRSIWGLFVCGLLVNFKKPTYALCFSLTPTLISCLNSFSFFSITGKAKYLLGSIVPGIEPFNKYNFLILLPLIFTMIRLFSKKEI
tara:strand:+ start:12379 stop:12990 length:612 start_codon:yes stop_codon:yes gene_type:complete